MHLSKTILIKTKEEFFMNNPTNLIYLFFLKYPIKGITSSSKYPYHLESQAFMFQHYLHRHTPFSWNHLFYVYQSHAMDKEFGIMMAHFIYHGFVDTSYELTDKGSEFLSSLLTEHPLFKKALFDFHQNFQKLTYLEGTFLETKKFDNEADFVPVSFFYKKQF